jgi:hypothetical protein
MTDCVQLAFLVLLLVWMGEVFSILSLRSRVSICYFPRFFVCFFSLFHIYFFCYPFGFAYIALLTTALFLLHTMMHLWNSYEVPAYYAGRLSALQPRLGVGSISSMHHSPSQSQPAGSLHRGSPSRPGIIHRHSHTAAFPAPLLAVGLSALPPIMLSGRTQRSNSANSSISYSAQNGSMHNAHGIAPSAHSSSHSARAQRSSSPGANGDTVGGRGVELSHSTLYRNIYNGLNSTDSSAAEMAEQSSGISPPSRAVNRAANRHSIVLSNIYESVEARRLRLKSTRNSSQNSSEEHSPVLRIAVREEKEEDKEKEERQEKPSLTLALPRAVSPSASLGYSLEELDGAVSITTTSNTASSNFHPSAGKGRHRERDHYGYDKSRFSVFGNDDS